MKLEDVKCFLNGEIDLEMVEDWNNQELIEQQILKQQFLVDNGLFDLKEYFGKVNNSDVRCTIQNILLEIFVDQWNMDKNQMGGLVRLRKQKENMVDLKDHSRSRLIGMRLIDRMKSQNNHHSHNHHYNSNNRGAVGILRSIETKLQQNPVKSIFTVDNMRSGLLDSMINRTKKTGDLGIKTFRNKVYESVDWDKIKIRAGSISKSKHYSSSKMM